MVANNAMSPKIWEPNRQPLQTTFVKKSKTKRSYFHLDYQNNFQDCYSTLHIFNALQDMSEIKHLNIQTPVKHGTECRHKTAALQDCESSSICAIVIAGEPGYLATLTQTTATRELVMVPRDVEGSADTASFCNPPCN